MDLSAYIGFAATLDKSQSSPVLQLADTGSYPSGVPQQLIGFFSITQPDGLTVSGSFTAPNVQWISGQLTKGIFALRLDNANGFQQGGYSITYGVRVPGYTDTFLTKTFILSYASPVPSMSNSLNLFTPDLQVSDLTNYTQPGWNPVSSNVNWSVLIQSVLGTNKTVTGSSNPFDMNYQGSYYDALYGVTMTITPSYQLQGNTWVTIIDKLILSQTLQAQIPPTLTQLQAGLTALNLQLGATLPSSPSYSSLLNNYNLASSLYDSLVRRGQNNDLTGLDTYIWKLQKIFNNNVNPVYVNTNGVIPAYNWGSGGAGSVAWTNITGKPSTVLVEGYVGTAMPSGATYTDSRLVGIPASQLLIFRNKVEQDNSNLSDGDTYFTKNSGDSFITFNPALTTSELLKIMILAI